MPTPSRPGASGGWPSLSTLATSSMSPRRTISSARTRIRWWSTGRGAVSRTYHGTTAPSPRARACHAESGWPVSSAISIARVARWRTPAAPPLVDPPGRRAGEAAGAVALARLDEVEAVVRHPEPLAPARLGGAEVEAAVDLP